MNKLSVYTFDSREIRTVLVNDDPWFVAKDVCDVLDIANNRDAISRLTEQMKGVATVDTPGGPQQMVIINEAGVYKIAFTSRKAEAERFTDWIAEEVLPSIRKTGQYSTAPKTATEMFLMAAKAMQEQEQRIARLEQVLPATIEAILPASTENWRESMTRKINAIIRTARFDHSTYRHDLYRQLEERARVDLNARLRNLRLRMVETGRTRSDINNATKLDVIESEPKLREILEKIVSEQYVRYVTSMNGAA